MRKFKGLRTGKYCAQATHAGMSFLTRNIKYSGRLGHFDISLGDHIEEVEHWLENSFRKIVCYVNSEEELMEIHEKAIAKGLMSHMIIDNGATEFNNVKTVTCLALGPHFDSKFIGLTDHLPLL